MCSRFGPVIPPETSSSDTCQPGAEPSWVTGLGGLVKLREDPAEGQNRRPEASRAGSAVYVKQKQRQRGKDAVSSSVRGPQLSSTKPLQGN